MKGIQACFYLNDRDPSCGKIGNPTEETTEFGFKHEWTSVAFSSLQLLIFLLYSRAPISHLPLLATLPTTTPFLCSLKTCETTELVPPLPS